MELNNIIQFYPLILPFGQLALAQLMQLMIEKIVFVQFRLRVYYVRVAITTNNSAYSKGKLLE